MSIWTVRKTAVAVAMAASLLALGGCNAGSGSGDSGGVVSEVPAKSVPEPVPAPASGPCDANRAMFAVGLAYDDALGERARKEAGARTYRPLIPGLAVTMEFSADRLNLELDDKNTVVRVSCG